MRTDAPLNLRHREILSSIVSAYIETGEPVGSRTISKLRMQSLSPASIRNVMADLVDSGYLSQPHTSAGRIPTGKAFRVFVQALSARRVAPAEAERVASELRALDSVGERMERSSSILTELTRNMGIAAALPELEPHFNSLIPIVIRAGWRTGRSRPQMQRPGRQTPFARLFLPTR